MATAGGSEWAYYSRRSKDGCRDGRFMMRSAWLGIAVIAASGTYLASLFVAPGTPAGGTLWASGSALIAPVAAPRLTGLSSVPERRQAASGQGDAASATADDCRGDAPAACTAALQTAPAPKRPAT